MFTGECQVYPGIGSAPPEKSIVFELNRSLTGHRTQVKKGVVKSSLMKVTQICRERERKTARESDREMERETDGEGRERESPGDKREVWEREESEEERVRERGKSGRERQSACITVKVQ